MIVPLKVTTDYTLMQSLIKVKDLVSFCVSKNIKNCAICDTNLFGSIEFYKLCKENNINPIIGLEINIYNNPLYLYAKNYNGYRNLLKINTIVNDSTITIDNLKNNIEDIVFIIPYKSIFLYDKFKNISDRYLGYQNSKELTEELIITDKVVYVKDIKMFQKEDLKYIEYLNKISDCNINFNDCYYDYDNLKEDDLNRFDEIINLFNLVIPEKERHIPKYDKNCDSFSFLYNLSLKGLKKRLNNNVSDIYLKRLNYELSVIKKMGFVDYFLIVYDYVLYAKKNNILVGPGRGSAAGSLVSYVIGITDIDPIKYNLLFERFLNYERVSMPDIDIDFDSLKREEVINYVKKRYGNLNVAGGLTYTTFKSKLILRDLCKIYNIDERLLNKFLSAINRNLSLKDNLKNKNVNLFINNYSDLKEIYMVALKLEGLKKNISTHAAGIVISDVHLDDIIPVYKKDDVYLAGVDMSYLENLGLLKMDFLALKNLTTINNIITKIPNFKLNEIPLDDKNVYNLFSNGNTDGIFQFETYSFKNILPKFRPQNFSELVALIALNRPGPVEELERYIKRKNKKEAITYYDDSLKDILIDTYGIIIYQEQVISILVKMANFSYAEADNIRRAMAKKKEDVLIKNKEDFINRSIKNGYKKELASEIYNHILKFASYGFNKAHSVSYAIISYQMAYLKVHYSSLFIFELLNNSYSNLEYTKSLLNELKRESLIINHVDINHSKNEYNIEGKNVYLGYKSIKNFKSESALKLINEINKGLFLNIYDFFRRTISFLNKEDYLLLIKSFCLNSFKYNVNTLLNNIDSLINYALLTEDLGDNALVPEIEVYEELDKNTLRQLELNNYGFYISNHPASKYTNVVKCCDVQKNIFKIVKMCVIIENIKYIKTKSGEDMAFISGSDETGNCNFTIFPKNFYMLQNIKKDDIIKIIGNVSKRYDKLNVIVTNLVKDV